MTGSNPISLTQVGPQRSQHRVRDAQPVCGVTRLAQP